MPLILFKGELVPDRISFSFSKIIIKNFLTWTIMTWLIEWFPCMYKIQNVPVNDGKISHSR